MATQFFAGDLKHFSDFLLNKTSNRCSFPRVFEKGNRFFPTERKKKPGFILWLFFFPGNDALRGSIGDVAAVSKESESTRGQERIHRSLPRFNEHLHDYLKFF